MSKNELLTNIRSAYITEINSNETIQRLLKDATNYEDAYKYAKECGKALKKAFRENISEVMLPDGQIPYDIAYELLNDTLKHNHVLVSNRCEIVQNMLNIESGFRIKAVKPKVNQEKIDGIVKYISDADKYSQRERSFLDSLETYSKSIVDESIKINVEDWYNKGIQSTITRIASGKTCKWCLSLQGTYNYEDVKQTGNDVFRRHANCDCLIIFNKRGSKYIQNVHSKQIVDKYDLKQRIEESNKSLTINREKIKDKELLHNISRITNKPIKNISIPPKVIKNIETYDYDYYHINKEKNRDISKNNALQWINESKISIDVWDNTFRRYYGYEGTVYVDLLEEKIRTAYSKSDYKGDIIELIKELKKHDK